MNRKPAWIQIAAAVLTVACSTDQPTPELILPIPETTSLVALTDLGSGRYKGFTGGLYLNGSNTVPAAHAAEGRRRAGAIKPRDVNGNPAANGKIVLLSIGMSNGTQEFCNQSGYITCQAWTFMGKAAADATVNHTSLTIVNGARGGQVASAWATSTSAEYVRVRDQGLTPLGLSEAQVQVVWTKLANSNPSTALPDTAADAYRLQRSIADVLRALKARYPNLQMVFMSSRMYAGFATTTLNPEPYAYETGFAHKWAIEDQIQRADYSGAWGAWGPYLWAGDESKKRSDGLFYVRTDLEGDGTHPSPSGEAKVGDLLLSFFKTSEFTSCWFLAGRTCPLN